MLLAEVAAARLVAVQGVEREELGQLEEVGHASGLFQLLVQLGPAARHAHVLPELLAQLRDLGQGVAQAGLVAGHAAVVPHQPAERAVELVDRAAPVDLQQPLDACLHLALHGAHDRVVEVHLGQLGLGQVVADGQRQDEVAIG